MNILHQQISNKTAPAPIIIPSSYILKLVTEWHAQWNVFINDVVKFGACQGTWNPS